MGLEEKMKTLEPDWGYLSGDAVLTRVWKQIVNPKGEMKGSAITGPVGKEAAELWPVR